MPEPDIKIEVDDVVCHRHGDKFVFSVVLAAAGDVGGFQVMSGVLDKPVILKQADVVSVYREVLD